MQFERHIKYLDYLESGERVKGAGFLKLQTRNGRCDLQIQVSGMHATDSFTREVFLVTAEEEVLLGEIALNGGKGALCLYELEGSNLAGAGVPYESLLGIRIPIAAGREIRGVIREDVPKEPQWEEAQPEEAQPEEEIGGETTVETYCEEVCEEGTQPEEVQAEDIISEETCQEKPQPAPDNSMPDFASAGLAENKWLQLWKIYPHITPFKDEREYLTIGPEDFVILPAKYYRMANNSFLLHGYYNYRHLILCRMEQKGQPVFYIGVPGNYFDREKEVAVLFGFESFECAKEPVKTGDYGYYMMRVEL
ncbi:MAG: hypothetical protein E7287_04525 [Lachnospiraceae bacterium]|nr:hypothetical protein [Lachnospiraceae bacterium]